MQTAVRDAYELDVAVRMVDQLVVPAYLIDTTGLVIAWNQACVALTGLPAAAVMGTRQHWRAFSRSPRPCLSELLLHRQATEIGRHFSVHHPAGPVETGVRAAGWFDMPMLGSERYLEIDACEMRDRRNCLIAVFETMRDMTERERARERFRRLFESSPDPVWIIDQNKFVDCNDAAFDILGYASRKELLNTHPSRLSPSHQPDGEGSFEKAERMMALALAKGLHRFEWVHQRADGSVFDAEVTLARIELEGRQAIYCTWRDISDRKKIENELRLYATVFQSSGEAILITDRTNKILAINDALTRNTGYTIEDLRGADPKILASGLTGPETYQAMWEALNKSGYWQGELWDKRKDGSTYAKWAVISANRAAGGEVLNYIASFTDISLKKAAEEKIAYLAHHDTLTGLLNRHSLESRLAQALALARRANESVALILLDMDRFKLVNDSLGHHVGDMLLTEVAARLSATVRDSDIVARLGGDEFVVCLTGVTNDMDTVPVVKKLQHVLSEPYLLSGKSLHLTPSIGVSIYPGDAGDAECLMKNADTAMYCAKDLGRNNFQFFTGEMTSKALERLELERDLHKALELQQFELFYQPQVQAQDNSLCAVEALIRWNHAEKGLIAPLKFIPVAEETGMIGALGGWVLDQACRQLADWQARGIGPARVAVNVSVHQLRSGVLIEQVSACLRRHRIAEGSLEIEITESAAMQNPEHAIVQLKALRQLGVRLAIDDFGTGYSSLAYLKLLPIQTLKLDRTFVRDIETDENDAAISAAALALAHNLGLQVVAEGVETEPQRAFLNRHGCDILQGYLCGRPAPAAEWERRWGTPQGCSR